MNEEEKYQEPVKNMPTLQQNSQLQNELTI